MQGWAREFKHGSRFQPNSFPFGRGGRRFGDFADFKIQRSIDPTFGAAKDSCGVPSSFNFLSAKCGAAVDTDVEMKQPRCWRNWT